MPFLAAVPRGAIAAFIIKRKVKRMSKYTKEEQIEIVGWARNLEAAIESEKTELLVLGEESFKPSPAAPRKKVIDQEVKAVEPAYPAVPQTSYKFDQYMEELTKTKPNLLAKIFLPNLLLKGLIGLIAGVVLGAMLEMFGPVSLMVVGSLLMLLGGASFLAAIIYYFIEWTNFRTKRAELNNELANEPAYLAARTAAENYAKKQTEDLKKERALQQEKADAEYLAKKKEYDEVILPAYQKELAEWKGEHEMKVRVISDDLSENETALEQLYRETKLIPQNFRSLEKLIWIYEDMSTSEHNIERAMDVYNAQMNEVMLKQLVKEAEESRQDMRKGFAGVYSAIEEGNFVTSEIAGQLSKTRRDMIAGFGALGVQGHNRNKKLDSLVDTFVEKDG